MTLKKRYRRGNLALSDILVTQPGVGVLSSLWRGHCLAPHAHPSAPC